MTFPAEDAFALRVRAEIHDRRVPAAGWMALLAIAAAVAIMPSGINLDLIGSGEIGAAVVALYFLVSGLIAFNFEPPTSRLWVSLLWGFFAVSMLISGHSDKLTIWLILGVAALVGSELLSRATSSLRAAATTDPLTGLRNRAGLVEECGRAVAICRRMEQPLTLVHIDLDGFKEINDREGHAQGDRVLRQCADSWSGVLREEDILARIGGDEFLLVLPGSDSDDARRLMGVLKKSSPTDWSFGVAELAPGEELQACVDRADAELYSQKDSR